MDNYKYYAFISYKREDEKWAKWLQRKLEYYRIPMAIRKQNSKLPKRVRPVFKDTTDLCGGVLEKVINEALDASKYLIVICSPRAAKSTWVCKEVQRFISRGREEFIIPFIIEGTPFTKDTQECYPEALKVLSGSREMLGIRINELGRDAAAIKVVTHMLGLDFNELWQRYRRAERCRIYSIIVGLIFLLLLATTIASYIYNKNVLIKEQNERIQAEIRRANTERDRANAASDSIRVHQLNLQIAYDRLRVSQSELQQSNKILAETNADLNSANQRILEERNEMLAAQSRTIAGVVTQLLEEGDVQTARALALGILPDNIKKPDRPYVPEAELALRKTLTLPLYSYNSYSDSLSRCIEVKNNESLLYEPLGVLRGRVQYPSNEYFAGEEGVAINPSSTLLAFFDKYGFYIHDIYSGNEYKLEGIPYMVNNLFFSEDGKLLYARCESTVYIWDVNEMKLVDYFDDMSMWNEYIVNHNITYDFDETMRFFPNYSLSDNLLIDKNRIFIKRIKNSYKYNKELFNVNKQSFDDIIRKEDIEDNCDAIKYRQYEVTIRGHYMDILNTKTMQKKTLLLSGEDFSSESMYVSDENLFFLCNDDIYHCDLRKGSLQVIGKISINTTSKGYFTDINNYYEILDYDSKRGDFLIGGTGYDMILFNKYNNTSKIIKAVTPFTIGNSQEFATEASFIDANKILVIVSQGSHRIIDIDSGEIIQYFFNENYWTESSYIRESFLPHCSVGISSYSYIKDLNQLYTISTGAVLKVYDVNTGLCIAETELPNDNVSITSALEWSKISNNGEFIKYKFENDDYVYTYKVQNLQALLDEMRKCNKRVITREELRKYNIVW